MEICSNAGLELGDFQVKILQKSLTIVLLTVALLSCCLVVLARAAVLDSYLESFDNRQDSATIDGVNFWKVSQGEAANALTQSNVTFSGSGKALKLTGALAATQVGRPASYGSLSPSWIRFSVRPSASAQTPNIPASGIAAVCFNYDGKILAANGSSWLDTGMAYTVDKWYDVAMKLNFKTHRYDIYVSPKNVPEVQFVPLKSGLKFIDSSLNSLSKFKFYGSYSAAQADDVYIDDVSVTYIDRLEIISAPQVLMLGQPSSAITVQLQNADSQLQTAISDIILELKSSSPQGRFSLDGQSWGDISQLAIPKDSQSATFYYKDSLRGKPLITVSEYPEQGFTDALQQLEILSQPSYFDVEVLSPRVAGEGFQLKITAKDEEGNIAESYSGNVLIQTKYISPASGGYKISPDNASGFIRGKMEVTASYPDCGLLTITVADSEDTSKAGTSGQILFLPASFELAVDNPQTVSKPFTLRLSAKNASGVTTPNYNSAVNLYPVAISPANISDGLLSPAVISGSEFKYGAANAALSYNLYGSIKIRAEDSSDAAKTGLSQEITFLPKDISISIEPPTGGRDFFYLGEPIRITVKVRDEFGNPIPNYPGAVGLSSTLGLALPAEYTFTNNDAGQHTFSANPLQPGTYTIVAEAEAGRFRQESAPITVKNALIQVVDTALPVGSGEVIIQLVDDSGNVITSENNLAINVQAVEDLDDNSVSLPSGPITLTKGRASIPIYNTQAETVTIVPSSPFKINVKKGTVIFGRAGETGIGTLLWRELKKKK